MELQGLAKAGEVAKAEDDAPYVLALISDGRQSWSSIVDLATGTAPHQIVGALLDAARGCAAGHSLMLHSMLVDQLGAVIDQPALSVSIVDHMVQHAREAHGKAMIAFQVPGVAEPVPVHVVKAVLAAAGVW